MPLLSLHIKNMVCDRCIKVIDEELTAMGLHVEDVQLGYAQVSGASTAMNTDIISEVLQSVGFELLKNEDAVLLEQIKVALRDYLAKKKFSDNDQLSVFLSRHLGKHYSVLSKHFSKNSGETIEKYFIKLRIEKVKELVDYGQLTLSQIAFELGYKSVQHLSAQFRKLQGISVSEYKKGKHDRRSLDNV